MAEFTRQAELRASLSNGVGGPGGDDVTSCSGSVRAT